MYEGKFGTGIISPFQRNGQGDFLQGSGETLLNSDIKTLLGISVGELRWDTKRGTQLVKLLHRRYSAQAVEALAMNMVGSVLDQYEDRVRLTGTSAKRVGSKLKLFTSYRPLGYSRNIQGATVEQDIG